MTYGKTRINGRDPRRGGKREGKETPVERPDPCHFLWTEIPDDPFGHSFEGVGEGLETEAGENVLIDLDIRKGDQSDRKVVMLKDIQIDPLQSVTLHTDFYEVTMDQMVTVEVPIHLVGKPEGTKMGGILEQVRRVIQVQCLPTDIPKGIDVDVSPLKIGDSIHVQDIQAEKVKIISETNFTIATVVPPVVEEKVAEAVAPEVAEGAEVKEEEGKGKEKEGKGKEKEKEEKE